MVKADIIIWGLQVNSVSFVIKPLSLAEAIPLYKTVILVYHGELKAKFSVSKDRQTARLFHSYQEQATLGRMG